MKRRSFLLVIAIVFLLSGCLSGDIGTNMTIQPDKIPEYSGAPYVFLNENVPSFTETELSEKPYEQYAHLDFLGRCGTAMAMIGKELMPTEEREPIGQIKPSGWQTIKYDFVDGKYLYNRCHLIGFQLTGENANERNLITGTRYMNVEGMLPFENMIADYIKETDNHVLLRVTPVYDGNNLVASGVMMEAQSVEDAGDAICFYVYCYNVQPGVLIDYATGDSSIEEKKNDDTQQSEYVLNKGTKKVHRPDCPHVEEIQEKNKETYVGTFSELMNRGYSGCKKCVPQGG